MKIEKVILILFLTISLFSSDFKSYKSGERKDFNNYKREINSNFQIYRKRILSFKKIILKKWPKFEITMPKKWVWYDKNFKSKVIIDYKGRNLKFEIFAKNREEAKKAFIKLYKDILKKDIKRAFREDFIEKSINKEFLNYNKKLLLFTQREKRILEDKFKKSKITVRKYKNRKIYQLYMKLPKNTTLELALSYKKIIKKYSKKYKISIPLILAIIETESSFNPMARSEAPAFGLMQIIPTQAGEEAFKFIYGYKKIPTPAYLYNPENNIKIGVAYLHLLYYNYFKDVKDKTSKLYCTISAYNAGVANVAKSFSGEKDIKKSIKKINLYQSDFVYTVLIHDLPKVENREYLDKVLIKMEKYQKLESKFE